MILGSPFPIKKRGFYLTTKSSMVGRGGSNFTNLAAAAKSIKSSIWAPLAKLKTGLKPNLNHDFYYIGEPTTKITGYIFLCPEFFAL